MDVITWHEREIATSVDGDGPPIVLNHGTPFSSRVWEPVVPTLATSRRVYRWDMPGYGKSSKRPEHAVDLDTQARALTDLVERTWALERPVLIAHDIGGAVALRAHLHHGLELSQLILLDTVCLDPWGTPFYRQAQQHADVFASLPAAYHRALLETYLAGVTHRPLDSQEIDALAAPWLGQEGQRAFYEQIRQVETRHTVDIAGRLDHVRCPAAVLWGADDEWLPVDQGRELAAQLDAPFTEIADAGHLVMFDQPAELIRRLDALIG